MTDDMSSDRDTYIGIYAGCTACTDVVTETLKPVICTKVEVSIFPQMKQSIQIQVKTGLKTALNTKDFCPCREANSAGWLDESSPLSCLAPGPCNHDMYSRKTLTFKGQKISEHFLFLKFVPFLLISILWLISVLV